jgi:bifunctional non-homologous end joining protein LigD
VSLHEYHRKRDFATTPEPRGRTRAARVRRIFVVQHHRASHDHDDFRLEFHGTLKSWAVPKRVSRRTGVKRLAVQVEDHPLAYASFEGTIPSGAYGAGTVTIWDHGTWEPEGSPSAGLKAGRLAFTLHGAKLTGRWALVRMPHPRSGDRAKPQWLLFRTASPPRAKRARPATR